MEEFRKAYEKLSRARIEVNKAMIKGFPIGCTVIYLHGSNERRGTVDMHSYADRVRIISPNGKPIWLDAYRIERVEGGPK